MQKEHQPYNIQPANRLANVSEYYFSRKLKEVAQMNAEGKNVISLGIGSPDMPPSEETVQCAVRAGKAPRCSRIPTYCRHPRTTQSYGRLVQALVSCRA